MRRPIAPQVLNKTLLKSQRAKRTMKVVSPPYALEA